jgi:hypothetical protein
MRLAFDPRERPEEVYEDIDRRFYGHAGAEMHAYWQDVDRAWVESKEYSGGHFAHAARFTPAVLARLRAKLDAAKAAAVEHVERDRIEMADSSLQLFEDFLAMRHDFDEGRFENLDVRAAAWKRRATELALFYKPESAFSWTGWAPEGVPAFFFDRYDRPRYEEAARIVRSESVLAVTREFRFMPTENASDLAPSGPAFDASAWRRTNVAVESWSSLGLHSYFGSAWYRAEIDVATKGPATVWLGGNDGRVRVFVDGKEARFVPTALAKAPEGYTTPLSFEAGQLSPGKHVLAVLATRTALNELGTGGLMGPVVLYR